jgi:hypothetical protein
LICARLSVDKITDKLSGALKRGTACPPMLPVVYLPTAPVLFEKGGAAAFHVETPQPVTSRGLGQSITSHPAANHITD